MLLPRLAFCQGNGAHVLTWTRGPYQGKGSPVASGRAVRDGTTDEGRSVRNRRSAFLSVLVALTVLSGCGGSGHSSKPSATPSPTGAADVKYVPLNLGLPKEALTAPVTGAVPGDRMLHAGVTLKISDATWKQYGHGKAGDKDAQGLARKLGVSDEELKKLNAYFADAHIQAKPSKTRTSLTFDVKASVAGRLLKTSFVTHKLRGRSYFTPDPAHMPVVPAQIAGYILSVTGLDSYSIAPQTGAGRPGALSGAPVSAATRAGQCPQFPPRAATNLKVAAAYGYDRLWQQGWHGENMTVNLVEMDGYDPRDIAAYTACTGAHVSLSNVNLGASAPPQGGEATLDIEMLAGLAPGVRIIDYQEDPALLNTGSGTDSWTAFNNALQRIIDDNVDDTAPGKRRQPQPRRRGGPHVAGHDAVHRPEPPHPHPGREDVGVRGHRRLRRVRRPDVRAARRLLPLDVVVGGRGRRDADDLRRARDAPARGGLVGPLESVEV